MWLTLCRSPVLSLYSWAPHCWVSGGQDGTVRFWDLSCTNMHHLYRLRTQKLFEKNKAVPLTPDISLDDDPYAITNIAFSSDTKHMVISGQTDQVRIGQQ